MHNQYQVYAVVSALVLVLLLPPSAEAGGPALDLPPAEDEGAVESLLGRTTLGGYGEVHFNYAYPADALRDKTGKLDFHRLVLYVGHKFNDDLTFYSEIEVEHADEIFLEQAYVDYRLYGKLLTLRAGMFLVPMGIVNPWHEPPTFHGVERPWTAQRIIPSTWREAGVGFHGEPWEGLRYQLYVVGGLDALGFSASQGLRGGRQKVSNAKANAFAFTGRLEYEPLLGLVVGVSTYVGDAGPNAVSFLPSGEPQELVVNVAGFAGDVRFSGKGIEARAVVATFGIKDTQRLRDALDANGDPIGTDVGSRILGYYLTAAYDVLDRLETDQQLLPFVRFEVTDTLASIDGRARTPEDDNQRIQDLVLGLTYRPVPTVAFKADLDIRRPGGDQPGETVLNLGMGLMF